MGPEHFIIALLLLHWLVTLFLAARLKPLLPRGEGGVRAGRVSIIIPARNEEENLPELMKSLRGQEPTLEIIVVDDDSEDRTASLASELGATLLRPGPPPPGWRGKPWACFKGAEASEGDWLLFLDADIRLQPDGVAWICRHYPGGAWSVIPWHTVGSFPETLSAFFNLLMALGTLPNGLAGPCLMVEREMYLKTGGHALAQSKVLENITLGVEFRNRGISTASTPGRGVIHFRMYPGGLRDLVDGWTKGFATGAANTPRPTLILVACWIGSQIMATGILCLWPGTAWLYLLYAIQFGWMLRRVGNFPWWLAPLFPILLFFYLVVFVRSMGPAGKQAVWKGRKIGSQS